MRPAITLLLVVLASVAAAQPPPRQNCENTPEHRQFDFWLGTWDVTDQPGKQRYGTNTISKREGGCLLLEAYSTPGGFSGSSVNYYNPVTDRWYQQWVDNGTSIIQTEGGIQDGSMVMEGVIYYMAAGNSAPFRGAWTPLDDGRIRQLFEQRDSEGTWQVWFDGYYSKVDQPAGASSTGPAQGPASATAAR